MTYSILYYNKEERMLGYDGYFGQHDVDVPDYYDEERIMEEFWMDLAGFGMCEAFITPYLMIVNNDRADLLHDNVVYVVSDGIAIKIGCSSQFAKRCTTIQNGNPRKIFGVVALKCEDSKQSMKAKEVQLHKKYLKYRIKNIGAKEWFSLDVLEKLKEDFNL